MPNPKLVGENAVGKLVPKLNDSNQIVRIDENGNEIVIETGGGGGGDATLVKKTHSADLTVDGTEVELPVINSGYGRISPSVSGVDVSGSNNSKEVYITRQDELFSVPGNARTIAGKSLAADITLDSSDVGLGNVDNTSDADKPISDATQTALDEKYEKPVDGIPQADLDAATQQKINTIGAGGGDMLAVDYDPNGVGDNVYDMGNMTENANDKILTAAERLAIADAATAIGNVGALTTTATDLAGAVNEIDSDLDSKAPATDIQESALSSDVQNKLNSVGVGTSTFRIVHGFDSTVTRPLNADYGDWIGYVNPDEDEDIDVVLFTQPPTPENLAVVGFDIDGNLDPDELKVSFDLYSDYNDVEAPNATEVLIKVDGGAPVVVSYGVFKGAPTPYEFILDGLVTDQEYSIEVACRAPAIPSAPGYTEEARTSEYTDPVLATPTGTALLVLNQPTGLVIDNGDGVGDWTIGYTDPSPQGDTAHVVLEISTNQGATWSLAAAGQSSAYGVEQITVSGGTLVPDDWIRVRGSTTAAPHSGGEDVSAASNIVIVATTVAGTFNPPTGVTVTGNTVDPWTIAYTDPATIGSATHVVMQISTDGGASWADADTMPTVLIGDETFTMPANDLDLGDLIRLRTSDDPLPHIGGEGLSTPTSSATVSAILNVPTGVAISGDQGAGWVINYTDPSPVDNANFVVLQYSTNNGGQWENAIAGAAIGVQTISVAGGALDPGDQIRLLSSTENAPHVGGEPLSAPSAVVDVVVTTGGAYNPPTNLAVSGDDIGDWTITYDPPATIGSANNVIAVRSTDNGATWSYIDNMPPTAIGAGTFDLGPAYLDPGDLIKLQSSSHPLPFSGGEQVSDDSLSVVVILPTLPVPTLEAKVVGAYDIDNWISSPFPGRPGGSDPVVVATGNVALDATTNLTGTQSVSIVGSLSPSPYLEIALPSTVDQFVLRVLWRVDSGHIFDPGELSSKAYLSGINDTNVGTIMAADLLNNQPGYTPQLQTGYFGSDGGFYTQSTLGASVRADYRKVVALYEFDATTREHNSSINDGVSNDTSSTFTINPTAYGFDRVRIGPLEQVTGRAGYESFDMTFDQIILIDGTLTTAEREWLLNPNSEIDNISV